MLQFYTVLVVLMKELMMCHCRDFTVSCSEDITIDRENPLWHYYFLCGVKGIQVRCVNYSALSICSCGTVVHGIVSDF